MRMLSDCCAVSMSRISAQLGCSTPSHVGIHCERFSYLILILTAAPVEKEQFHDPQMQPLSLLFGMCAYSITYPASNISVLCLPRLPL